MPEKKKKKRTKLVKCPRQHCNNLIPKGKQQCDSCERSDREWEAKSR